MKFCLTANTSVFLLSVAATIRFSIALFLLRLSWTMLSRFHGLSSTPTRNCLNDVEYRMPEYAFTNGTNSAGEMARHHTALSTRSQFRVHQERLGQGYLCGGAGVRVGALTPRAPGGAASPAPKPWVSSSHEQVNGRSRVRKRAYIRAMKPKATWTRPVQRTKFL